MVRAERERLEEKEENAKRQEKKGGKAGGREEERDRTSNRGKNLTECKQDLSGDEERAKKRQERTIYICIRKETCRNKH